MYGCACVSGLPDLGRKWSRRFKPLSRNDEEHEEAECAGRGRSSSYHAPISDPAEAYSAYLDEIKRKEDTEVKRKARRERWDRDGLWPVADSGGCVGLTNIRNTCWMNSVIQSLAHLEPFAVHFLAPEDIDGIALATPSTPVLPSAFASCHLSADATALPFGGGEAQCEGDSAVVAHGLRSLLQELWQEDHRKAVTPWRFHMCLTQNASWATKKAFRCAQDASEFLLFIVNALHEELDRDDRVCNGKLTDDDAPEAGRATHNVHGSSRANSKTLSRDGPIAGCFQGELQYVLSCDACGFSSHTYEKFFHLSVTVQQIDPGGILALGEALHSEFAVEHLCGEERWHCEKCGGLSNASKRTCLHRLPEVVVLHLKRFSYSPSGKIGKIRTPLTLAREGAQGLEGLDLGLHTTLGEPFQESLYDVVSIVNHHGRDAVCGHYTAHCRHCVDGRWYAFNDDLVTPINDMDIWLPEEAYILCLVRQREGSSNRAAASSLHASQSQN